MPVSSKLLYAILFLILFGACEGGTTFIKSVSNQSSEQVEIQLFLKDRPAKTYTIAKGTSVEIFIEDHERVFVDDTYQCTHEFDSVKISVSNGKTLHKDFLDSNNWQQQSSGGANSKEECTFIITSQDLM